MTDLVTITLEENKRLVEALKDVYNHLETNVDIEILKKRIKTELERYGE